MDDRDERPASRIPLETFLQVTTILWKHLQAPERKAIRSSCRGGLQQHDRLLDDLHITLGPDTGHGEGEPDPWHSPPPHQLRTSLQAVLGRGTQLQTLAIFFDGHDAHRQAQL